MILCTKPVSRVSALVGRLCTVHMRSRRLLQRNYREERHGNVTPGQITPPTRPRSRKEVRPNAGIHRRTGSRDPARRRDKVYFLLRTGQLRSIKIGKLRRITTQHLAEFVASLEDAN